jgi:hypothetical protein
MKDLPIKTLLHMKKYEYLIEKFKNTGIIKTPQLIIEYIIQNDDLTLYIELEKYFTNIFENNDVLFNTLFSICKKYDIIFLPIKLLNHLFNNTNLFNNLEYTIVREWFYNSLRMNHYDFAFSILSRYSTYTFNIFVYILFELSSPKTPDKIILYHFDGRKTGYPSLKKSKEKYHFTSLLDFTRFFEKYFPGGIGLYLNKKNNTYYFDRSYTNFEHTIIDYYRQYHWLVNTFMNTSHNNTIQTYFTEINNKSHHYSEQESLLYKILINIINDNINNIPQLYHKKPIPYDIFITYLQKADETLKFNIQSLHENINIYKHNLQECKKNKNKNTQTQYYSHKLHSLNSLYKQYTHQLTHFTTELNNIINFYEQLPNTQIS